MYCLNISNVAQSHLEKVQQELKKPLRRVLFVVQVMSDVSKQDCIHNKWISILYTKMRICIHY